ncbi:hypothetical protein IAQ61_002497 [Plenodomus lingam]|uniref:uncharacterized protein n=1 Tax=Leptosphaeria maculans TaxID=5022 RepID=UPI0033280042|nr:hypothetical protein IAQ61_002497 [Plenodomus lingam]
MRKEKKKQSVISTDGPSLGYTNAAADLHTIPLQDDKTLMTSNNQGNSIPLGEAYAPHSFIKHDHSTLQDRYLMSVHSAPALSSTPSFPSLNPPQYNNTIISTLSTSTSGEPLIPSASPPRKRRRLMISIPPNDSLRPIDDLPLTVDVELRTRFVNFFRCNRTCLKQFGGMIRNPASQLASDSCIQGILGDEPTTYRYGGQHKVSADDACSRRGHPCTHISFHKGDPVLVFVPLSERLRGEAGWQELRFWVLG